MAITDVYFSPAGAGAADGSSAANAFAAISSSTWSSNVSGTDIASKRFIFLAGTYEVNTELAFTGTSSKTAPFFFVGADAAGNVIDSPKWEDGKRLRIDNTNIPKFEMTGNNKMLQEKAFTFFRNVSFEVTSGTFTKNTVCGGNFVANVYYFGCKYKAALNHSNGRTIRMNRAYVDSCSFESTTNTFQDLLQNSSSSSVVSNSSIVGPGTSGSGSHEANGFADSTGTCMFVNNIVVDVPGAGVDMDSGSVDNRLRTENNTIVNCGGNGIQLTDGIDDTGSYHSSNIIFNCGANGIDTNSSTSDVNVALDNAMGEITGNKYNNFGDKEDGIFDGPTVLATDFYDYANLDFRIRRDSALYKATISGENHGAIQNEDYEFVSVS